MARDPDAATVIDANSIRTFFSPLADLLLHRERGVLAMVLPVTAGTGASGLAERRFLSSRFHIERIITTHDPKRINFSENTSIHECLLIARRSGDRAKPTEFVSLARMPKTPEEADAAVEAIAAGRESEWGEKAVMARKTCAGRRLDADAVVRRGTRGSRSRYRGFGAPGAHSRSSPSRSRRPKDQRRLREVH